MKSLMKKALKMLGEKSDEKGVAGMNLAKSFVIGFLSLIVVIMLVVIIMVSLNTSSIKTATNGTSTLIVNNGTQAISQFSGNFGTWFTILGVVILVLLIVVIIVVLQKMGGGGNDYTA